MAKRKMTVSSKKEAEIEKAFVNTNSGKSIFNLAILGFVAFLTGFLIIFYQSIMTVSDPEFYTNSGLITLGKYLLVCGSVVCVLFLLFYIKFASSYKETRHTEKKTVAKKRTTKK